MKVGDESEVQEVEVNVILGWVATSLTRTKEPFEGDLEGKVMFREQLGVKVEGMIGEGSREADLRLSMNAVVAIVDCRVC